MANTRNLRETEIQRVVQEAKDDLDACLVSPMWGYIDPKALGRQHKAVYVGDGSDGPGSKHGQDHRPHRDPVHFHYGCVPLQR